MAVPRVICDANIEKDYSASTQLINLSATATESPTSWQWTMLSIPVGSTANVGVNGDFTDGVAAVQNPTFNTTGSVSGTYVLQLIATNASGSSEPDEDRENGQQVVFVKTEHRGLIVPNRYQYDWGNYLNVTLNEIINVKLDELEEPDSVTTLNAEVGKHGLCPALSGTSTEFLDGDGNFSTPTGIVPSAHGDTHKGTGSDAVGGVTAASSGLCPTLSNVASEFLDGQGNWSTPSVPGHNTNHITGGSDIIPAPTTAATGLCPALPSAAPTTKFLRGDATWTVPSSLGAHATDHIDSGSDTIPVATASNTGLCPVRSGAATDYLDGTGNWSEPSGGGGGSLDDAYDGGESITVDALPVTLNRTQTSDDQPAQKIAHDYNGNQGTGIDFVGSASSDTPDGETIRGASISVPKQVTTEDIWYAVGGTTIARKIGAGAWAEVSHGLTITKIYDVKGFDANNVWVCGQAPDGLDGKAFVAYYDGTSWSMEASFNALFPGETFRYAPSLLVVNDLEVYAIVVQTSGGTNINVAYRDPSGIWSSLTTGTTGLPSFDLARKGNQLGITKLAHFLHTNDITKSSPDWVPGSIVIWPPNNTPHGLIYDTSGNRYISANRASGDQYVRFYESTDLQYDPFAQFASYDGGSGDYNHSTTGEMQTHSLWHDGAGKVYCTANHTVSSHVFIHSIESTPVGVATTDRVYGLYGLSASNIKMGTDKTGYLKAWNGSVLSDENVGVAVDFDQVWAVEGSSGTATFEGKKIAFTGAGNNETSAIRVGAGATHALKADSGVITLKNMANPKHVVDSGSLFTKQISNKVELCYRDDQTNIVQLTNEGKVNYESMSQIYRDDTNVSNSSSTYVEEKSFYYAIDYNKVPVRYDVIVELWNDGLGTTLCEITMDSDSVELSTDSASPIALSGSIPLTNFLGGVFYCSIQLKVSGGGPGQLRYTHVYAVY